MSNDHFFTFPEISWYMAKQVLLANDFQELKKDDGQYLYFTRDKKIVMVPKENKIYGLTVGDIVAQSGIPKDQFLGSLINIKLSSAKEEK